MINSCCTLYHILPEELGEPVILEESSCDSCKCHCGYVQFEALAPYMPKLLANSTTDEDYLLLETKLRTEIVEFSRLLDKETGVEPGHYSKAHYKVIKLYADGTKYLRIPEFVKGTLELYTQSGHLINPKSYTYNSGYLILNPCEHTTDICGCSSICGKYEGKTNSLGWQGCLQAKAMFGKECPDASVGLAVKSYLIEWNTYGDVRETNYMGLPVTRGFKIPVPWTSFVKKTLDSKRVYTLFAVA